MNAALVDCHVLGTRGLRSHLTKASIRPPTAVRRAISPRTLAYQSRIVYSSPLLARSTRLFGMGREFRIRPLTRQFATSAKDYDTVLLEGKTESVVVSLWKKYKLYALGAGGVVVAVSLLGVATSAIAVVSLASLAGGIFTWYKLRIKKQQTVLRVLYEPVIEENRANIEKLIGPFELPDLRTVASDSATGTCPYGGVEILVRNVFYMEGATGKALVRAMGVKNVRDGTYKLRKLIIDAVDYRRSMQDRITLVDDVPKLDYVDSPSFKTYTLDEYVNIKNAAMQTNRDAARDRIRQELDLKARIQRETEKQTLYSNKPKKSQTASN